MTTHAPAESSPSDLLVAEVRALTAEVRAERGSVDAYRAEGAAYRAEVVGFRAEMRGEMAEILAEVRVQATELLSALDAVAVDLRQLWTEHLGHVHPEAGDGQ